MDAENFDTLFPWERFRWSFTEEKTAPVYLK